MKVDDDYFPIVESAMDDSREALTRLCQQDPNVNARMPPNNLNDSVSRAERRLCLVVVALIQLIRYSLLGSKYSRSF